MTDNTQRTAEDFIASIEAASNTAESENRALREQMNADRATTNKLLTEADAALNEALAVFEEAEPQVITEDDIQNTPSS